MGSIFDGYAQIWRTRGRLVGVVALVFGAALGVDLVIGLAFAGPDAPILNGAHLIENTGIPVIVRQAVLLFGWLWAVMAGTMVVIGQTWAIWVPVRRLLGWTVGHAVSAFVVFGLVLAGCFGAVIALGGLGPPAALVVLAVLAILLGWMLFMLPGDPLSQRWSSTPRGRWWRTAGLALFGVLALPLLGLAGWQRLISLLDSSLAGAMLLVTGMVIVVAGQAGALAKIYLNNGQGVDREEVEQRLLAHAGDGPGRRVGLLAGLVLVPGLALAAASAINPFGVPRLNEATFDAGAQITAVGWPEGQHPIVATADGFLDCRNATCSDHVRHTFTPVQGQVIPANSVQEITAAGMIVSVDASTAGRLVVQRCVRTGACSYGEITTVVNYPDLAVTASGQTVYIATAKVTGDRDTSVNIVRCDDPACARHVTLPLGKVDGMMPHMSDSRRVGSRRYSTRVTPMRVVVDSAGRPAVAILGGFGGIGTKLLTCDTPECATVTNVRSADNTFPLATTVFETVYPGARVGQGMVDEANSALLRCGGFCELDLMAMWGSRGTGSAALIFGPSGMVAVTATDPVEADFRLELGIGTGLSQSRYKLWRCGQTDCRDMDSILLNVGPKAVGLWLAVRADGSAFVAQDSGMLRTVVVPVRPRG